MKNNIIFIMTNHTYFSLTIAFLNSVKRNWPLHPKILCHYTDLSETELEKLSSYSNIELIPIILEKETELAMPMNRTQDMAITYFKLNAWSYKYDEYDNILYIDTDTLVLKPLDELLDSEEFAIMKDPILMNFINKTEKLTALLKEDDLHNHFNNKIECPMINAGLFVLPKKYRTKETHDYIQYLRDRYNPFNFYADQAIITLWWLKNKIPAMLSRNYNFFSLNFNRVEFDLDPIYVIHFIIIKPCDKEFMEWKLLKRYKNELSELFNHYLRLR